MVDLSDQNHGADINQSFPVEVSFVPMFAPSGGGKIILAERARFSELLDFLEVEFYRGLAIGNAPRRCHNCGRYFLLTNGYNTCYCNNIAPGETERTCRKVGAHRKANHPTGLSPAGVEYRKVYNRLKARKQRGRSAGMSGTPLYLKRRGYWIWRSRETVGRGNAGAVCGVLSGTTERLL